MPLRDVRGHRRLLDLLAGAIARNTLPPTLLFDGPDGVGKRTTAIALAQELNCLQRDPAGGACGRCAACRRIARGAHPDVVVLEPGDSGAIKTEIVREQVIQASAYRPFEGRVRVFIIDEADALILNAQDALLKSLEEPPPGSVFILVTSQPDRLLPTVLSRCYRLRFGRVSEADIAAVLRERYNFGEADARAASAIADGSVGRALAAQRGELTAAREIATQLLRAVANGRVPQRLEGAKGLLAGPRSGADRATVAERLRAVSSILRDLGVLSSRAEDALLANADIKAQLDTLLPAFAAERVLRAFSAVDRASVALERNASPKIVADWVALEI
ncbi:MAG TPA: DNA polymerase III subunit delta' [Vicinamibacterales bacterium]|nr:DNA polymerase III subunit delta' [Vicinamibacterales bacterium]